MPNTARRKKSRRTRWRTEPLPRRFPVFQHPGQDADSRAAEQGVGRDVPGRTERQLAGLYPAPGQVFNRALEGNDRPAVGAAGKGQRVPQRKSAVQPCDPQRSGQRRAGRVLCGEDNPPAAPNGQKRMCRTVLTQDQNRSGTVDLAVVFSPAEQQIRVFRDLNFFAVCNGRRTV